jgi:hypothetical protein
LEFSLFATTLQPGLWDFSSFGASFLDFGIFPYLVLLLWDLVLFGAF